MNLTLGPLCLSVKVALSQNTPIDRMGTRYQNPVTFLAMTTYMLPHLSTSLDDQAAMSIDLPCAVVPDVPYQVILKIL